MYMLSKIVVSDIGYMVIVGVLLVCVIVVGYILLFDDMVNDVVDEDEDGVDDREDPFDME